MNSSIVFCWKIRKVLSFAIAMISVRLLTWCSSLKVGIVDLGCLDCVRCPLHHLLCTCISQSVASSLSSGISRRNRLSRCSLPCSCRRILPCNIRSRSCSCSIVTSSNRCGPAADQPLSPAVVSIRDCSSIFSTSTTDIAGGTSSSRSWSLHQSVEPVCRNRIREYFAVDCGFFRESKLVTDLS